MTATVNLGNPLSDDPSLRDKIMRTAKKTLASGSQIQTSVLGNMFKLQKYRINLFALGLVRTLAQDVAVAGWVSLSKNHLTLVVL